MASGFPVGPLAMAWMPRTSQSQTLTTLMRKLMLNFGHFWIHNLTRAPGLDLSLAVAPNLIPGVLVGGQVWAPPIIQQLLGGLLVTEMSLDCKNWMVLMQAEWNKDDQALLIWCVLWWWLGQSTADHHQGLPVWHWVGLVCQTSWWLLTVWMWCLAPHPSSVLPLMIAAHRTEQPCLGQSLQLLSGQICYLKPCLPQWVPAMCEEVVVSPPIFGGAHLYFQTILGLRPVRC